MLTPAEQHVKIHRQQQKNNMCASISRMFGMATWTNLSMFAVALQVSKITTYIQHPRRGGTQFQPPQPMGAATNALSASKETRKSL